MVKARSLNDVGTARAESTLRMIGSRIRQIRTERSLTLQALGQETGLSASMLSLVERGKASPSVGSLVAISAALGVHLTDLFSADEGPASDPVSRQADQPVYQLRPGSEKRILRNDPVLGIEVAINAYEPHTTSAEELLHHPGHEYGIVLQGKLTVELDGAVYRLDRGDLISYDSTRPHRISNPSTRLARALWLNVDR